MSLQGKTVLVTGATGFIGGRVVEKLILEHGARVRALVRNFAHASRIARFPLEMIGGEVTDPAALRRAADGCDAIVHCAFGNSGNARQQAQATVSGTETVARAALAAGVARLVHVSTVSVYGIPPDGDLDERAPRRRCGDHYSDTKLAAERLVFDYHRRHRLPVAVLQPTVVYGPFSAPWTHAPLDQLKSGRVVLVGGGGGLCNAVYVDDVADAILLAAVRDEAVGEAFLISGDGPVTWRQFYSAYETMLGCSSTVAMSPAEVRAAVRQQRKENGTLRQVLRVLGKPRVRRRLLQLPAIGVPYRLLRSVLPTAAVSGLRRRMLPDATAPGPEVKPLHLLDDYQTRYFQAKACVVTDKARRLLGYQPRIGFADGIRLTAEWARWANLL